MIATLAAIAGALAAVAVYLRRREKELDEYERLLFGEDKAEPAEAPADAPAEDAAE
ncbi:MAG: phosphatase [Faecalibacterium sp.]